MNKYTLYCTPEQTRKALELGAPIELESEYYHPTEHDFKLDNPIPCESFINGYHYAKCPTAEQMTEWLRKEQNIHPRIDCEGSKNYVVQLQFVNSAKDIDVENHAYRGIIGHRGYMSFREATLAAVDKALEYLSK